ncbi:MAG: outer membrane beta-barrel protein [Verrucomicrobiia bacterium]
MTGKAFVSALVVGVSVLPWVSTVTAQNQPPPPPRPWSSTQAGGAGAAASGAPVGKATAEAKAQPGAVGFVVPQVAPREAESGWSFGVYGGANLGQFTDNARFSYRSSVQPAAGIKFGYTWPFDAVATDQFQDEFGGFRLGGGIEVDLGYMRNELKGTLNGVGFSADVDSAVFVTNFLLKGRNGKFQPYIGPGIGAAFMQASNYNLGGRASDDQVVFVFQGVAGLDYFFTPQWSLFGEYRFLGFQDVELYQGAARLRTDRLYNNILSLGIRRTF